MIAAADNQGTIQLFNTTSRTVLRKLTDHKSTVSSLNFFKDNVSMISTSDDSTVKLWDVPSGTCSRTFTEHSDYVRCSAVTRMNSNLFLSGSYDGTVKVWDSRSESSALTLQHDHPVESVLILPGSTMAVSSGSNLIKLWDVIGGKLLCTFNNHQKTVTSLAFDYIDNKIVSGSLDRMVKIFDISTFEAVCTFKFDSAILSIALAPDNSFLVGGMSNGQMTLKKKKEEPVDTKMHFDTPAPATRRFFDRGPSRVADETDLKVEKTKAPKYSKLDKYLRKFEHSKALETVFRPNVPKETVHNLIQELIRRDALFGAFSDRDEGQILPIVDFITRYIIDPNFSETMVIAANTLLDIYGSIVFKSLKLQKAIHTLSQQIAEEVKLDSELIKVLGSLELIIARTK